MSQAKPIIIHEPAQPFEQIIDLPGGRTRWKTLLSADRTPTEAMTVGITEIEPSQANEIFLHQHTQPEVYYILAGHGVVQISGEAYALQPGSLVFIPGDAPHGLRNSGDEVLRLLYVFTVDSLDEVVYKLPEKPKLLT
jgi:quercetin dioxygenase-like cupin family protein